jgi:hypothetical protein
VRWLILVSVYRFRLLLRLCPQCRWPILRLEMRDVAWDWRHGDVCTMTDSTAKGRIVP